MNNSLIMCKNVSFSYDGMPVVENINFNIYEGNYICIVGENGAGKSTLMKGLLGLKKPSSGTIKMADGLLQTDIGYLPQQTALQRDFPASVYEVVLSGTLNKNNMLPFYTKNHKNIALSNMKKLGIMDLKNKFYRELSGGQQQRVLIARALCAAQKILLLDEPVTGLDPLASYEMYKLISDINKKLGIAIVMISHDIDSACEFSDRILHINKRQLFNGTPSDYLKSEFVDFFRRN